MRVLILAGGFAKRMGDLGRNVPKSLLEVAGRPVIEHILDKIDQLDSVTGITVSTNKKFKDNFSEWLKDRDSGDTGSKIDLLVEPAMEEGQKLGSIGALKFFVDQSQIEDDLLVINGDNLFEFNLRNFMDYYKEKSTIINGVFDTKSISEAQKLGVVLSDQNGLVMDFEEKPEKPKSTTVSTGIYLFPKSNVPLIRQYIEEGNSPDRMGDLLIWMMKSRPIHAFVFSEPWFDIGSPETYRKAGEDFNDS
jgi:glucose-1-phosphate thymidylyltransferase